MEWLPTMLAKMIAMASAANKALSCRCAVGKRLKIKHAANIKEAITTELPGLALTPTIAEK